MKKFEKFEEKIVKTLKNGEMSKSDIARELNVSGTVVGKYVEILRAMGIVSIKEIGPTHVVSLRAKRGLRNVDVLPSNVQSLLGEECYVDRDIDPKVSGLCYIDGEAWNCRPFNEEQIEKGSKVKVIKVDGVHLYVEKIK